MRHTFFYTLLFAVSVGANSYALTDSWSVDVRQHTAVQRTYKQGETWSLQVSLRDGLKPLNLTGAEARFHWYTNATDNVWWTNSAAITAPATGLVTVPWTPAMDVGASSYAYWVGIWMPGATSPLWRVTGTIRLLPSPGFVPNAQPVPVRTLDFSAITLTNAPWVTASDWASGSNALAGAVQSLSDRVDAIPPPPVVPVVSVNGYTGAVTVTAASLGALTAEADPVAGPRLAIIEGKADNWDAAYGWGNHALAGYLVTAAWQSWLGTNTYVKTETDSLALAAQAAYATTNKVTRWQDSANSNLWWEVRGSTQILAMARLETPQLVIRTGTASFVGGAIPAALVPSLTAWTSSGYTGMFRYYSALGDPGVVIAQIDVEGEYGLNYEQAIWNGPVPEYGAVSEMPLIYTSGEMAATGTAVAEWVSEWPVVTYDLTALATTQQVAQAIAANLSSKLDAANGTASNLAVTGWFALPQSMATNLVLRLVGSNEHIFVEEVYQ